MKELIDIQKQLAAPFPAHEIEWRIQSAGEKNGKPWARVLAYINARAVMDRLDSVLGVDGWKDEYTKGPDGGILCTLTCLIDGVWIPKQDGAENTNIDPIKGGISGALKRAAVKFGVGRYLYRLTDNFAIISDSGSHYQQKGYNKDKTVKHEAFKWDPPALPLWALPSKEKASLQMVTILEEYLEAYKEQKNNTAIKAISEALKDGSFEKVQHMIEYCERKQGGQA